MTSSSFKKRIDFQIMTLATIFNGKATDHFILCRLSKEAAYQMAIVDILAFLCKVSFSDKEKIEIEKKLVLMRFSQQ